MQDHVEFKDTVVATKRNKVIMFLAISIHLLVISLFLVLVSSATPYSPQSRVSRGRDHLISFISIFHKVSLQIAM
jgi:hypothetical protein